jgi:DNA-binding SARP family transcriptional activator
VDAVVLRGGQVSLWPHADLATDVEAFEAAATRALQVGDPAACRSAAALYGGELLPAARYEDWAAVPRQRLQRLLLELLRLAGLWEQVLALDPSDEAACRALMRHHRDEGQRAAAARAFQRLRQALRAELGLDPSPQTAALYAEIVGMTAPGKVRGRSAP